MASATILLVDDDEALRHTLAVVLQEHGFRVTTAGGVPEALRLISAGSYDVLLSDLHMPGRGDGLTVVSAMRHANPNAVTMLFSAFRRWTPPLRPSCFRQIRSWLKPMNIPALIEVAAEQHGRLRYRQGYSAAMMVEESRMLQVSIFETLQKIWRASISAFF